MYNHNPRGEERENSESIEHTVAKNFPQNDEIHEIKNLKNSENTKNNHINNNNNNNNFKI